MEISILTSKCTLVPSEFFDAAKVSETLSEVVGLDARDVTGYVEIPQYDAWLLYAADDSTGRLIDNTDNSGGQEPRPELFFILRDLPLCQEHNKILCTYRDGFLHMAIAEGSSLRIANVYKAQDFTTAEYYIFLAMKSLQLNPEVSVIYWRLPIDAEEEMSLYRYFKSVELFRK